MSILKDFLNIWSAQTLDADNIFSFKKNVSQFNAKNTNLSLFQNDERFDINNNFNVSTTNSDLTNNTLSSATFFDTLKKRNSYRNFSEKALAANKLFQVLNQTFEVKSSNSVQFITRPYPSPGCLNSNIASVLVLNIDSMQPGFYHYSAFKKKFSLITPVANVETCLQSLKISAKSKPAAIIILSANFRPTLEKYGPRSLRFIYQESGAILQTLYLVSIANNLCGYAYGGGLDLDILTALKLHQSRFIFTGLYFLGERKH